MISNPVDDQDKASSFRNLWRIFLEQTPHFLSMPMELKYQLFLRWRATYWVCGRFGGKDFIEEEAPRAE